MAGIIFLLRERPAPPRRNKQTNKQNRFINN